MFMDKIDFEDEDSYLDDLDNDDYEDDYDDFYDDDD